MAGVHDRVPRAEDAEQIDALPARSLHRHRPQLSVHYCHNHTVRLIYSTQVNSILIINHLNVAFIFSLFYDVCTRRNCSPDLLIFKERRRVMLLDV